MQKITNFLMFNGNAEEAMNFYVSLFPGSEIVHIIRYKANETGIEGTVMHAAFKLNGQLFMCIDSSVKHEFTHLLRRCRFLSIVNLMMKLKNYLRNYQTMAIF